MGNQNSWCSLTAPQQWCILPCLTPTPLAVLSVRVFQAPQALLEALPDSFPGKTTGGHSQYNEGSIADQHMAFCTCVQEEMHAHIL